MTLRDVLQGAVLFDPDDLGRLVDWAVAVENCDGKLHPRAGFGFDTTGHTVRLTGSVGDVDTTPGDFEAGWVAMPATGDCPGCESTQPLVAIGNPDADIAYMDCVNCRTRYSPDAFPDTDAVPDEVTDE